MNRQERKRLKRKQYEIAHNICSCATRTFAMPIRQATAHHPVYGDMPYTVYRCEQCGREYTDAPAMA